MNVEKFKQWIWQNENMELDEFGLEMQNGDGTIDIKCLLELLDTHAVVPREPSYDMLANMNSVVRDECKDFDWARQQYHLAIKASEEEK